MLLDLWPNVHRRAPTGGGYFPPTRHELRARTRLRYTLTISTSGAVEHHTPPPIHVRTTTTVLAGARTGSRHTHHLTRAGHATITTTRTITGGQLATHTHRLRIDDPDEWVIFGDPNLS